VRARGWEAGENCGEDLGSAAGKKGAGVWARFAREREGGWRAGPHCQRDEARARLTGKRAGPVARARGRSRPLRGSAGPGGELGRARVGEALGRPGGSVGWATGRTGPSGGEGGEWVGPDLGVGLVFGLPFLFLFSNSNKTI
jgi:hypothetical protein